MKKRDQPLQIFLLICNGIAFDNSRKVVTNDEKYVFEPKSQYIKNQEILDLEEASPNFMYHHHHRLCNLLCL